ncbi:MAG: hypothetical protein K0Q93_1334, partial [Nocardioidaceae bacterium]|nr:hypothetical protein [Nocardioidaceae bacterium]
MKLDALLAVDVLALETDDTLSTLVQLTAPPAPHAAAPRTPST